MLPPLNCTPLAAQGVHLHVHLGPPDFALRATCMGQLRPPLQALQDGVLAEASQAFGGQPDWGQLWGAICGVWGSKWGDRAWLSRRARGVPDEQLFMACLLQQVWADALQPPSTASAPQSCER